MKISDILEEKLIRTSLPGQTKDAIINAMVDLVSQSPKVLDKEKVRAAILEREKIMSTGVGNGFAIPHGKTDAVADTVAGIVTVRNKEVVLVIGAALSVAVRGPASPGGGLSHRAPATHCWAGWVGAALVEGGTGAVN